MKSILKLYFRMAHKNTTCVFENPVTIGIVQISWFHAKASVCNQFSAERCVA
jgi:hypothetical protein